MKDPALIIVTILVAASCGTGSVLPLYKVSSPNERDVETTVARDRTRNSPFIASFPGAGNGTFSTAGMYYTRISLGSPPKEYTVLVDTGSNLLWVSCEGCIGCPQNTDLGIPRSFFDTANSTTATQACPNPPCNYTLEYVGASTTSGYLVNDVIFLPSATSSSVGRSVRVTFGCSTLQTGLLTYPTIAVDGIFGFGQGDVSVLSQLQDQQIAPRVFSHCLVGDVAGGGFLVLGQVVHPNIQYSPLIPSQTRYNLDLQSITINGQLLRVGSMTMNGNAGILFDSGTSMTYLPQDVYDSFAAAINKSVSQFAQPHMAGGELCYEPTSSGSIVFPSPILTFAGGATMTLRPQDYLVNKTFSDGSSQSCMGIYPVIPNGFPILGEISMKDKLIVYDMYQQRVGWADYDCRSSYDLSTSYGFDKGQATGKEGRTWILNLLLFLVIFW